MRRQFTAPLLSAVGAGALFSFVIVGTHAAPQEKLDGVAKLQAERIETLKLVVTLLQAEHNSGGLDIGSVLAAQQELLRAQLESATGQPERVALRKQQVELAIQRERLFEARFRIATAARVDQLAAKAARLEAEILLLREQQG